ncbi:MAG: GNAT family N-acetyltransferase [Thermodesulfobacteriota bacterium]
MKYTISKHSEDFEEQIDQIARLKTLNWGLDFEVFKSYVKWNYIERPHTKPPLIYFARAGDETVAMAGLYETTWQLKSAAASFNALCIADLLIRQEYRGKGIYKQLTNYYKNDLDKMGVEYIFSFNPTPLTTAISLSTGWKSIAENNIMKKQFLKRGFDAIAFARKLAGPYAGKLLRRTGIGTILRRGQKDNSQRMDTIYHSGSTQLPDRISLDDKPRPAEMALLVDSILPDNKITLVRDESYFHWRYNNPLSKYLFLYCYDESMKGYLVLQSFIYSPESIGSHNIFELQATDPSIKIELLNALISIVNSGSISIWASMLDKDIYDYLASQGFKESDYTQTVMIWAINKHIHNMEFQGLNLADEKNWDLQMIYMHDH